MNSHEKALRKKHFEEDEEKGIKEYKGAIRKSEGKEKRTYKRILPQEKHHLALLKKM